MPCKEMENASTPNFDKGLCKAAIKSSARFEDIILESLCNIVFNF